MKSLTSNSRHTLEQIRHHPTTHNLEWRDIRKMFEEIGEAESEHNGNFKVTLSGKTMVFQSPQDSNVASEQEIQEIRRFMHGSAVDAPAPAYILLVMDHLSSKLYRTEIDHPAPEVVEPFDPDSHKAHVHSKHVDGSHSSIVDERAYFEDVAKALDGEEPLLIFGSGTGSSSTSERFADWLRVRHPKLAERIVQTLEIDASHLSEGELLAKARSIITPASEPAVHA